MTITETRPTAESQQDAHQGAPAATGLAAVLGSGDHKTLGRLFIGFSLLFGAASSVALALGLLGNLEGGGLFSAPVNLRLFTIGLFGLVFAFALPFFLGLAMVLVPLQVGAATVAFPRAAALSVWGWLLSIVTLIVANAIDGGIGGGNERASDLAWLALLMALLSLLVGAVSVATTAIALRAPGLGLDRVPMFTWSMLAATSVWLLTWPVFAAGVVLVRLDLVNAQLAFGSPEGQWSTVVWAFMQPQVYVLAIPVLGVVADLVATLTDRRQASRSVMLTAIGAFAVLSIGSWAQVGQPGELWTNPLFVVMSFGILLALLGVAGGLASTLATGSPRPSVPLGAGLAGLVLLLLAGVVGAAIAIGPLDLQLLEAPGTGMPLASLGHLGFVVAAVTAGAVAGLVYWASKLSGGAARGPLAGLAALAALGGGVLWGLALVLAGLGARVSALADATDTLLVVAAVGAVLVAGGIALAGVALATAGRGPSDDDPWGTGQSLEWATASPPATGNFVEVPVVASPEPLVDLRGGTASELAEEEA
jgi:heme/copper-type cytochrome/quinol oxidase subunit 1